MSVLTKKEKRLLEVLAVVLIAAIAIAIAWYVSVPHAPSFPVTGDITSLSGDSFYVAATDLKHPKPELVKIYVNASTTVEQLVLGQVEGTSTPQFLSQSESVSSLTVGEHVSVFPQMPVSGNHIEAGRITVLPSVAPRANK